MLVSPIDLEESASHPLPLPEGVPQVGISMIWGRRQGPMDGSEAISLRWRAMDFTHDSQSSTVPVRAAQLVE